MPFYEYECSSCKFYVEVLQKIADAPLRKCPSCKKQSMKKLVSAPVFRLKGSGWYETDFKSDGEDKRNIADRDEPAEKSEDLKPAAEVKADAAPDKQAESRPEVNTGSGDKKAAAKAEPRGERQVDRKGKPKAAPVKPAAKSAKPSKPSKPSRPVAKKAPAKKKAKRR